VKARRIEDEVFQHLSGRWALQILLALSKAPMRFIDLRRAIPGVSANTLTTRLRELEAIHFVERRQLPPPVAVQVYDLGRLGCGLRPTLEQMALWKADLCSLMSDLSGSSPAAALHK
jgi:DNA-binding HxlR family transcriptional regulator